MKNKLQISQIKSLLFLVRRHWSFLFLPWAARPPSFCRFILIGMLGLEMMLFTQVNNVQAGQITVGAMPMGTVVSFGGIRWIKIDSENTFMAVESFSIPETPVYMQDMTSEYCNYMDNFETLYLVDSRDGKYYNVRKFPDGNCWMIDNLRYGGSTTDGCSGKSTFDGGYTSTGVGRSVSGTWTGAVGTSAESFYGSCEDPRGITCSGTGCDSTYCTTHNCGYLYSWQAAIQNSLAYYGNTYQPTEPVTGICPTGWQLPADTSDNSFLALHSAMGYTTNGPYTDADARQYWNCGTGCTDFWQSTPWAGLFSGSAHYTGAIHSQGRLSYWWSSSQYSSVYSYTLNFGSGWVHPPYSDSKFYGFSVRCLFSP